MPEPDRPGSRPARAVLLIGAGKRVREDILPVLEAFKDRVRILGPYARTEKVIETPNRSYPVRPLDRLRREELEAADLAYLSVSKESVPFVLRFLARFPVADKDLLVEPPVLLFKHLHHARRLRAFRNAWAAEDVVTLPFLDAVRRGEKEGLLGAITRVELHRSAYKYHGIALLKTLFQDPRIRSARRRRMDTETFRRTLRFPGRRAGVMIEPRDYGRGIFTIHGTCGTLTDHPGHRSESALLLEPMREGARWTGFRLRDLETRLASEEIDLLGDISAFPTLTPAMHVLKRVGLYRILSRILEGRPPYPAMDALDDTVVDFWLDRVGFYSPIFPMSIRMGPGRYLLPLLSRVIP